MFAKYPENTILWVFCPLFMSYSGNLNLTLGKFYALGVYYDYGIAF